MSGDWPCREGSQSCLRMPQVNNKSVCTLRRIDNDMFAILTTGRFVTTDSVTGSMAVEIFSSVRSSQQLQMCFFTPVNNWHASPCPQRDLVFCSYVSGKADRRR